MSELSVLRSHNVHSSIVASFSLSFVAAADRAALVDATLDEPSLLFAQRAALDKRPLLFAHRATLGGSFVDSERRAVPFAHRATLDKRPLLFAHRVALVRALGGSYANSLCAADKHPDSEFRRNHGRRQRLHLHVQRRL